MNNELYALLLRWAISGAVISIVLLLLRRRITRWLQGSGEEGAGPASGFFRRGLAFYLDQGLFLWPMQMLLLAFPLPERAESLLFSVVLCAFVAFKILMERRRGQTPGKWLLGLRVQGPKGNPSAYAAWGRNSILVVFTVVSSIFAATQRTEGAASDTGTTMLGYGVILFVIVVSFFLLLDVIWYFWRRGHRMYHDLVADTNVVPSGSIRPLFFWLLLAFILLGNLEYALKDATLP